MVDRGGARSRESSSWVLGGVRAGGSPDCAASLTSGQAES